LRNLDFAAYQSLIEEDYFQQHVIPRKAKSLAKRLFRTLSPFFRREISLNKSQANTLRCWSKERRNLIKIFEHALRIKADTIVSKDLFEVVLYTPGTPFQKDVMEAETIEGVKAELSSYKTPTVKLCLLPAFQIHDHDRKLADNNNFVRSWGNQRSNTYEITKAVVVLETS
jgi:hypothetical protein